MKWAEMPELKDIVVALKKVDSLRAQLNHINPDRILYATFSKKNSQAKAKVGPIPPRFAIFLKDYDYFLEVNKEAWLVADEGVRIYIILHELRHIPIEGFDKESKLYKKTEKHDLEDFRDLVKEYGVDLENADKLVKLVNGEE